MAVRPQPARSLDSESLYMTGDVLQGIAGDGPRPNDQPAVFKDDKVTYIGVRPVQDKGLSLSPVPNDQRIFNRQPSSREAERGLKRLKQQLDRLPSRHRMLLGRELRGLELREKAQARLNPTGTRFTVFSDESQDKPALGPWHRVNNGHSLNVSALLGSHLAADDYDLEEKEVTLQGEQVRKLEEVRDRQPDRARLKMAHSTLNSAPAPGPGGSRPKYDRTSDYTNVAFHSALLLVI